MRLAAGVEVATADPASGMSTAPIANSSAFDRAHRILETRSQPFGDMAP
jgi:hypothetical protein